VSRLVALVVLLSGVIFAGGCGGGNSAAEPVIDGESAVACLGLLGTVDVPGADFIALDAPYHALVFLDPGPNFNVSVWATEDDAKTAVDEYKPFMLGDEEGLEQVRNAVLVWTIPRPRPSTTRL
jgi:hypothetical protein